MSSFQDQLATALVAKMAGMTLKAVDDSTVKASSSGPATKIDPLSFITSVQDKKKQEQQRMSDEAHRRAEELYPLPPPVQPLPPPVQPLPVPIQTNQVNQETVIASSEIVDILKSMDSSFKEIVELLKKAM